MFFSPREVELLTGAASQGSEATRFSGNYLGFLAGTQFIL